MNIMIVLLFMICILTLSMMKW